MSQLAGLDLSVVRPRTTAPRRPTIEEIEAAAQAGPEPTVPSVVDIAPETQAPLQAIEQPIPGAIEPNVQAVLDEQIEPVIPDFEEGGGGDYLPPVQGAPMADLDLSAVRPRQAAAAAMEGLDLSAVRPRAASVEEKPVEVERESEEIKLPPAKPLTTPEAADGTDVTFEKDGPAFQFTGSLVVDPTSGPEQGLDGMVPAAARAPVATMPGAGEPVLNRRPRLVPSEGGQIVFDQSSPERFTQGVEEAFAAGILPQSNYEKIKASQAEIFKVVDDRRKLEEKAQADPKLLAVLQGLGRGGAMTAGAVGGAKVMATGAAALAGATGVGAPLIPVAAAVGGTVGAIGGGIAAGVGYDALYKKLGEHFEQYDNVMKAAELYPMHKAGGEMGMVGLSLPVSVAQGARGLINTAQGAGGVPAALRQAGAAAGLGAGTGVVAYPIDAAVRGEEMTPGGFAAAAGVGALTGGFFINNRVARTPEVMRIFAKQQSGAPLTASEQTIFRAAYGPMESVVRRGQMDGQRLVGGRVDVPETTVAGMMPAAGRARVQALYESPARLPEGAVRAAQNFAASRPARPTGPAAAAAETAPAVPRQAPVNVIPPGETIIPPPPMTPAMMTPDAFAGAMATERGLDMDFNPDATEQLFGEHFRIVREAVNNNEPVSSAALDLYEMRVPYYVRDEETGLAVFDQATFDAWGAYVSGQGDEARADTREAGAVELIDAIRDLGGLPSPKSGKSKAGWSGELKSLWETSRGGRDIGIKGVMNLWRNDAPDLDVIAMGLKQKGFRVETEADLIELLDNRLRSGREIFGYPVMAEEMPTELRGRRGPAPGAPRQMNLIGEDEGGFQLTGQTDKTSLTPAEMEAQAAATAAATEADAAQGNLFEAAGGGAQVPPGAVPVGMRAINPPKWVVDRGETSDGRRLIKGFQNFKLGQKWSFGDVVRLVNKATQVEMRRTKTQVSRVHPAHYRPKDKVVFTESENSQINFHEAGHQFRYMLSDRLPDIFTPHEAELLRIMKMPGSMASSPPAGLSPQQQKAYLLGEGVAEWMRRLIVDPQSVDGMPVTKTIFEAADRLYPGMSRALRDAARAMFAFEIAPTENRIAMVNNPPQERLSGSGLLSAVVTGKEALGNYIASGAPVDRAKVKVFRGTMRQRKEVGLSYRQALEAARAAARKLDEPINAYNMILQLDAETQLAISGKGASKGLRVIGPDGNFTYFTRWTWNDLRDRVPYKHKALFDQGAWALESYERWKFGGMSYSGMREGITPDDLLAMVKQAKDTIPGFGQLFAEQMNWHHSLLEIREFGQILSAEERQRIQYKRDSYWPLPRAVVNERAYGGKTAAKISKGVMSARGSTDPTREIDEVTVQRTAETLEAYYWNRFFLTSKNRMSEVGQMKNLPWAVRQFASNYSTKLKMPTRKVATLNDEEKARIKNEVIAALAANMEKILGFKPEIDPKTVHVAFNFKDVWRPVEPGDMRVFSGFENGERVYYQLGDPAMFALFAEGSRINPTVKFLKWALGPMGENWKRMKTQGLGFAVHNMMRDIPTQMLLNPDAVGWIPGGAHVLGIYNKFSKKYPQVFQEGLLLSRTQPTESELLYNAKHSAVWQFLTQGLYVSNAKNPVVRVLATWLQPSNIMYPAWLIGDLVNFVTGGRKAAQFLEEIGREGAAVAVLRRGGTDEEAMKRYWMSSGQFNERPGVADVAAMVKIIPFGNPTLQATRNSIQALMDPDPVRSGTAWGRLAMVAGMASAAAAIRYLMMNKEERDEERNRTLEDRMAFANVGGFRMAYTYGPEGAIQSFAENAVMDHLLERKSTDGAAAAWMLVKRVFDPEGLLSVFGPQVTAWNEAQANWSRFRQKHIVAPYMVSLPPELQFYSTTPEFYREMGKMLNYSPAKLQYLVQQALGTQVDETIRLMESMDGGRPVQEPADIPFAGRLFVRDPIGFASQPVREASKIEDKLQELNARLDAKGYGTLGQVDRKGNMVVSRDEIESPELRRLHAQLEYLQGLRQGLRVLDDVQAIGKAYAKRRDFVNERNVRVKQTELTQAILIGNRDRVRVLEQALELLKAIEPASPEQQAADYLQRRF